MDLRPGSDNRTERNETHDRGYGQEYVFDIYILLDWGIFHPCKNRIVYGDWNIGRNRDASFFA